MSTNTFQALNASVIVPNDTQDITIGGTGITPTETGVCIYVGTGGNIRVTMIGGQSVIFYNVPNGSFLPIQVTRVWSTDTNASDMLALY